MRLHSSEKRACFKSTGPESLPSGRWGYTLMISKCAKGVLRDQAPHVVVDLNKNEGLTVAEL